MVNIKILVIATVVIIAIAVGLYFLLKKEKYISNSRPVSATIYLTTDAKSRIKKDEIDESIISLKAVLGDIPIKVAGPTESPIVCGYNGTIIVQYEDGTEHIQHFGKPLKSVGSDLVFLFQKFQ
jgi:hypothetical protein